MQIVERIASLLGARSAAEAPETTGATPFATVADDGTPRSGEPAHLALGGARARPSSEIVTAAANSASRLRHAPGATASTPWHLLDAEALGQALAMAPDDIARPEPRDAEADGREARAPDETGPETAAPAGMSVREEPVPGVNGSALAEAAVGVPLAAPQAPGSILREAGAEADGATSEETVAGLTASATGRAQQQQGRGMAEAAAPGPVPSEIAARSITQPASSLPAAVASPPLRSAAAAPGERPDAGAVSAAGQMQHVPGQPGAAVTAASMMAPGSPTAALAGMPQASRMQDGGPRGAAITSGAASPSPLPEMPADVASAMRPGSVSGFDASLLPADRPAMAIPADTAGDADVDGTSFPTATRSGPRSTAPRTFDPMRPAWIFRPSPSADSGGSGVAFLPGRLPETPAVSGAAAIPAALPADPTEAGLVATAIAAPAAAPGAAASAPQPVQIGGASEVPASGAVVTVRMASAEPPAGWLGAASGPVADGRDGTPADLSGPRGTGSFGPLQPPAAAIPQAVALARESASAMADAIGPALDLEPVPRGGDLGPGTGPAAMPAPGDAAMPRPQTVPPYLGAAAGMAAAVQVADAIRRTGDDDRIELRLDPPELGKVTIDLAMDNGRVTATVTAERPETLDLLRRHADTLQRELTASGFGRADVGFGDRGPHAGGADPGDRQHSPDALLSGPATAALIPSARGLGRDGRLDIRL